MTWLYIVLAIIILAGLFALYRHCTRDRGDKREVEPRRRELTALGPSSSYKNLRRSDSEDSGGELDLEGLLMQGEKAARKILDRGDVRMEGHGDESDSSGDDDEEEPDFDEEIDLADFESAPRKDGTGAGSGSLPSSASATSTPSPANDDARERYMDMDKLMQYQNQEPAPPGAVEGGESADDGTGSAASEYEEYDEEVEGVAGGVAPPDVMVDDADAGVADAKADDAGAKGASTSRTSLRDPTPPSGPPPATATML